MSVMDSNVIKFDFSVSRKEYARKTRAAKANAEAAEPTAAMTASVRNGRLRLERRDVWQMAEAVTRYWNRRLKFHSTLQRVQDWGLPEGRNHPTATEEERWPLLQNWRAALVKQLLTPSHDANSVNWKKTTFADGQHKHTDANPKKIEQAIADDIAWLAAHPTKRTGNVEACAKRRAFKEAMRQRIREIAATRNLSDEDIKPVLRLKHEAIGHFCQTYSVNIEWLLEGIEPMFKAWPTS